MTGTYYEHPENGFWSEENLQAIKDFISDFKYYCEGKPSCSNLVLDQYFIYATYDVRYLPAPDDFSKVLAEIDYLVKRFKLIPLNYSLTDSLQSERQDSPS